MITHMPFGRHKGRPLSEIPSEYLSWLLRECDLRPWLHDAVEAELQDRVSGFRQEHDHPPVALDTIITQWHRELVKRHHPDRGGSLEAMKAINDAADRLRTLVGVA